MQNIKVIGTEFENKMVEILAKLGYWAHFITPDRRGAQPFDIIAVKNGIAYAIDCKTCVAKSIDICRLEDNQIQAFELWLRCGNSEPIVMVEHYNKIYAIQYSELKEKGKVKLDEQRVFYTEYGI